MASAVDCRVSGRQKNKNGKYAHCIGRRYTLTVEQEGDGGREGAPEDRDATERSGG